MTLPTLPEFVDDLIDSILECPPMWGSLEAIEGMIITLLGVRAAHLDMAAVVENPRKVLDLYVKAVAHQLGSGSPRPLHARVPDAASFVPHMRAIVAQVIAQM